MALHAEDVAGFEHGGVGQCISAGGGGLFDHRHVIAVREVDVRVLRQAREQPRRPHHIELIPAHMRHAWP